ncbi:MAG TPA: hypothetical protein VK735_22685 [Pseudonocardia sp.]|uniref:hypothetical protein n=1 Tax=Pseudonocardia sp. TaxID=60912 RepID=UPI002B916DF0|nr:hypothetical protein [Pseudonocardia sp.]HTF50255.1 hypothetical protein [Pseudonocardia sp.]
MVRSELAGSRAGSVAAVLGASFLAGPVAGDSVAGDPVVGDRAGEPPRWLGTTVDRSMGSSGRACRPGLVRTWSFLRSASALAARHRHAVNPVPTSASPAGMKRPVAPIATSTTNTTAPKQSQGSAGGRRAT